MAILFKFPSGYISARCAQCARTWFLWRKKDIARFFAARKRLGKDLCAICTTAHRLGQYAYACAGCGTTVQGPFEAVRDGLNIHNQAFCHPCMIAIYGVYDEGNRALMRVIEATRSGTIAKTPHDYNERMAYNRAEFDYERRVRNKTRAIYKAHKARLNPDNRLIGPSGVEGAHHLDHIVPIRQCFRCGVPVEDAAAPENLQVVPWYINMLRGDLNIKMMAYARLNNNYKR